MEAHEVQALGERKRHGEDEQSRHRPLVQTGPALAEGDAEAHAQHGADENEVVEVSEDRDLARGPTDQGQLQGQDSERGQPDAEPRPPGRAGRRVCGHGRAPSLRAGAGAGIV
jgi:hypothetical protein